VSFGAVSAIVTSVGLIIKFGAAGISKPAIVNFATRFVISLSFVILVLAFSSWNAAVLMSAAWGVSLLVGLTWLVAKSRGRQCNS